MFKPEAIAVLERCRTILGNMALETTGWTYLFKRWAISDEPLRNDAAGILPDIEAVLRNPPKLLKDYTDIEIAMEHLKRMQKQMKVSIPITPTSTKDRLG